MKLVLKLLAAGVIGSVVFLALVPWQVRGEKRRAEIAAEIAKRTGFTTSIGGAVTIKLLPRPRLQLADVTIAAPDGSVLVAAPAVLGDLDIPSVLAGRVRLVSANLADATVTTDLDAGHFPSALLDPRADDGSPLPFRLSLHAAVVRLKSARTALDTLLTDVNATAHHHADAAAGLSLAGDALWHGIHGHFAFSVTRPDLLFKAGNSPASLTITSSAGALAASGDLTGGPQAQFTGHLAITTPALRRLASALGLGPLWIGAEHASLSTTALARRDDLSLSDGVLRLDDTTFEGTLGFHGESGRNLIEGTLATALLDVDKLVGRRLDRDALATLYRMPLSSALASSDLDLRVSASVAHLGRTEVQDAAFSALFHDGRLEVTVDEAHAYDGTIRARAVAQLHPEGAQAHGEITLSDIDVGAVSAALDGREIVSGRMSGKLSMDGRGDSLSDFVHSLDGTGAATVQQGRFVGVSISQALKRLTRKLPLSRDEAAQVTAFASATTDIGISEGILRLIDGKVLGPGIKLAFGGQTDLPRGRVDIKAVAMQTDPTGSVVQNGPRLPFEMRGDWGSPLLVMEHANALTVPSLPLPSLGDPPGLP